MRYLLAIAIFLAGALFPLAAKGQSVVMRFGAPAPVSMSQLTPIHDGGFGFHPFVGVPENVVFPPFFGYPPNYPFTYFYPGLWPPIDYQYEQAVRIAHGDVEAHVADQEKEYLSGQVQALTNEVRSLREQQATGHYMQVPAQSSTSAEGGAEEKFPSTVFVFQDGREMEVRDYAVFGDTLWVFQGAGARKFPLSDFNLAASRQVNEEHGVEFPLGKKH